MDVSESICWKCGSTKLCIEEHGPHKALCCEHCGATIKNIKQYKKPNEWSRKVKEDAGYKCARCGMSGTSRQMHAHHKIPAWFMPELKSDLSNGICLCNSCHKQIHGADGVIKTMNKGE